MPRRELRWAIPDKEGGEHTMRRKLMVSAGVLVLAGSLFLTSCGGEAKMTESGRYPVECTLEAEKKYVTGQPVNLRFSIRNQSDRTLYILTWYTPLEGIAGEIFSVTRDGEAVPYRGIMAKRGDPSRDEYIVVRPRAEASVVVDLAEEYDLSRAGRYQVEFTSRLHDVTDDESAVPRKRDDHQPQDLRCSTAAFEVARADD